MPRNNSVVKVDIATGTPINSKNPFEKRMIKNMPMIFVLKVILNTINQIITGMRTIPVKLIKLFTSNSFNVYKFKIGIKCFSIMFFHVEFIVVERITFEE
jgi:hypothetical protein